MQPVQLTTAANRNKPSLHALNKQSHDNSRPGAEYRSSQYVRREMRPDNHPG